MQTTVRKLSHSPVNRPKRSLRERLVRHFKQTWVFYVLLLPALIDVFVFSYIPMYGVQIAFRRYKASMGVWGSPWVGMKYILQFLEAPNFWQLLQNTLYLSGLCLLFTFPTPIILALMLNEQRSLRLKKFTQMITYMPHFISMVAVVGLITFMVDRQSGVVNQIRAMFGLEGVAYMSRADAFRPLYIISEVWQHTGWNAIIYLAALSSCDLEIVEAARIDGANRIQKIIYIDIPTILPTIVVLLIMTAGSLLNVGFEKTYLMQCDLNLNVSEIISTYVYKLGIQQGQFSYTTAIGLFNNVVNGIILILVNALAKRISGSSLW